MIRVDNSAKNRIFSSVDIELNENKKVKELCLKVIQRITEIENRSIEKRRYNSINKILDEDKIYKKIKNKISVFQYHELIENIIDDLIAKKIFVTGMRELKQNIYLLLISDIKTLRWYIARLKDKHPNLINTKHKDFETYKDEFKKAYENKLSSISSLFKKAFFDIFKSQNINVCPYCNRNFINPINKNIVTKIRGANDNQSPDIEHFFPKSLYPFLSLSISNLLPSCAFCNKIKSDVDTYTQNCISPYEINENDDRFRFEFDSINTNTRKINFKCTNNIKNSEVLHLNNLYNEIHSDYVNDMFTKLEKYPDANKKFLKKNFDLSEEDYKKEFCNYYKEDDFNKHPLSKMTKDLYEHIKEYGN